MQFILKYIIYHTRLLFKESLQVCLKCRKIKVIFQQTKSEDSSTSVTALNEILKGFVGRKRVLHRSTEMQDGGIGGKKRTNIKTY